MALDAISFMLSKGKGNLLIVGDGDFSYTNSLVRSMGEENSIDISITASVFEDGPTFLQKYEGCEETIRYLKTQGVSVKFSTDATDLSNSLKDDITYDCIVFNFPHVGGKSNIKKNRELLKQFFISSSGVLSESGFIAVTLCKGQSGSHLDTVHRLWHDSWKLTAMAAEGRFILHRVFPFIADCFWNYCSTGYRSQRKCFHSEGSQTYVFIRGHTVSIPSSSYEAQMDSVSHEEQLQTQIQMQGHPVWFLIMEVKSSLQDTGLTIKENSCLMKSPLATNQGHPFDEAGAMLQYFVQEPVQNAVCAVNRIFSWKVEDGPNFRPSLWAQIQFYNIDSSFVEAFLDKKPFYCFVQGNANQLLIMHTNSQKQIGHVTVSNYCSFLTVDLHALAHLCFGIPSPILWTHDKHLLNSVQKGKYIPWSLSPPEYEHDISFWLPEQGFVPVDFVRFIHNTVGDFIKEVKLIDRYQDGTAVSHCWHLVFSSHNEPLCHDDAVQLYQRVRSNVSQVLGVILR